MIPPPPIFAVKRLQAVIPRLSPALDAAWRQLPDEQRQRLAPHLRVMLVWVMPDGPPGRRVYGNYMPPGTMPNYPDVHVVSAAWCYTRRLSDRLLMALFGHEFCHGVLWHDPATRHLHENEGVVDCLAASFGYAMGDLRDLAARRAAVR